MNNLRNLFFVLLLALFSTVAAPTQKVAQPTKHFDKEGIAFDYPADWTLTEDNLPGRQAVMVAPVSLPTQIVVSRYRVPIASCTIEEEGRKIETALVKGLSNILKADADHITDVTTEIGGSEIKGKEFSGFIDQRPAIGGVYSRRSNGQFVSVAFIRRVDDLTSTSAWDTVRRSLKIEPVDLGVLTTSPLTPGEAIAGGVMNGQAISLPRPEYPATARSARATGTIVVQVTIDESGAVISAHVVSGNPLLHRASLEAARQAKFSPTKLCGEPVKVTGVITYNFVAM